MKQIDWDAIAKDVEQQVLTLAEEIFKEYASAATADAETFMESSKESLAKWSRLLISEDIDEGEFQSLAVKGQLDVAELHAMKQAGLARSALTHLLTAL